MYTIRELSNMSKSDLISLVNQLYAQINNYDKMLTKVKQDLITLQESYNELNEQYLDLNNIVE